MALVSALLALVVSLALMAAGSLFLLEETRLGESAVIDARATGDAERGIADALARWTVPSADSEAVGPSDRVSLVEHGRLGLLVYPVPVRFPAFALVSGGDVSFSPDARVEGPVDSGAAGSRLTGDLDLDRVASMADVALPAGVLRLVPTDTGGLGHPPVVHILGDARVGAGEGTGVLLVDGDLLIDGPFTFSGVILVRGALVVSGSGPVQSHLIGSVVTFVGARSDSSLWITYSKQFIDKVLYRFGAPEKLRSRSWVQLF